MSGSWQSVADVLTDREPPTAAQVVFIDMILGVIDDWIAGDITLDEAERESGDGWLRFQVIRKLPIGSDAGMKMRSFVGALCERDNGLKGSVTTKHGLITRDLLSETRARIVIDTNPETGERASKIQFPYKYPKDAADPLYPAAVTPQQPMLDDEFVVSPHAVDWFKVDGD